MSRRDYPKAARARATSAIDRNRAKGNRCMTQVGKVRAQQLAQGKPLSETTIKRTYSYLSRGQAYADPAKPNSCGSIAFDGWGGYPMLRWTRKTLKK